MNNPDMQPSNNWYNKPTAFIAALGATAAVALVAIGIHKPNTGKANTAAPSVVTAHEAVQPGTLTGPNGEPINPGGPEIPLTSLERLKLSNPELNKLGHLSTSPSHEAGDPIEPLSPLQDLKVHDRQLNKLRHVN